MAAFANAGALRNWVRSWTTGNGPNMGAWWYRGSSVALNRETGEMEYQRYARTERRWYYNADERKWAYTEHQREPWGPVTLGRFIPRYKTFLLNGDGFTSAYATWAQDDLRRVAAQEVEDANDRLFDHEPPFRVLLVPYMALAGGEIDPETIRPIDIQEDNWESFYHRLPTMPMQPEAWQLVATRPPNARPGKERVRVYEAWNGETRFRRVVNGERRWVGRVGTARAGQASPWLPYDAENWIEVDRTWPIRPSSAAFLRDVEVFGVDRNHAGAWRRVDGLWDDREFPELTVDDNGLRIRGHGWWERIHHLGASLFSAVGEDGKRHKFVSAFDEQEPEQMYFLAQLPDGSGATTYQEAVDALAPPIVHAARADGRRVFRQGDIFAIESEYTDEDVYRNAQTRVRREVALTESPRNRAAWDAVVTGRRTLPEVAPGEVAEEIPCPCRCGHNRRIGWGSAARNALMIYGTGHTATEVVVWENGATFIRGTMHHDPRLEEPGREPEHIDIQLGSTENDRKWYLAVRNTVPRRVRRRARRRRTQASQQRRRTPA